jgi:hypothetical protein
MTTSCVFTTESNVRREYPEGSLKPCEPLPRLESGDRASIILNRKESREVHNDCMFNHNALIEFIELIE